MRETKDVGHVYRTMPGGGKDKWEPLPPRFLYQNVMWPVGSTPARPAAHASSLIIGPREGGVQSLFVTFHWGPGEGRLGTSHGLVRITYDVDLVLEWTQEHPSYPAVPDDFDPYEPNDNPLFTYEGPFLIAQSPGRCHGNSAPYWDPSTGRFHFWFTTFVPKEARSPDSNMDNLAATDRRIFYKFSDAPEPWMSLDSWSEPDEWGDRLGLWARSPPVIIDDGGMETWLIAHNDESTWMPEYGNDWTTRFAVSRDKGYSWEFSKHYGIATLPDPPMRDGKPRGGIIQPSVVQLSDGALYCLCRSHRGRIVEMRSLPGGRLGLDWTTPRDTVLPNNNSGICQVKLSRFSKSKDHLLLVYNPTQSGRWPMSIAESLDAGETWRCLFDLRDEKGELSYPWMVQTPDGLVHCSYTLHRMVIEHDVFLL